MRNILVVLCLFLLTNYVRVSGRKHKGQIYPLFHSGLRGAFKVVDISQMSGGDKKLQATKSSSSSKSLTEDHAGEGHEEQLDAEYAWIQNGEPMSPLPDNYIEIQYCNKDNLKEGWKVNTCFLCTDGSDAEFSCAVTYESKAVFKVFSGTSCDGGSIATEEVQMSDSTGCGDGVDSIATYLELSTPYLIDDSEVGTSWNAYHGSCGSVSPFYYWKPQLLPIAGTSDFCYNENDDGEVLSYRLTPGCNWLQEHNGANCVGDTEWGQYERGFHGMCFPHEIDPEWIHEESIQFDNLGYGINTTFASMNTIMQSYGSSCSTGSPAPIACLTKTGLPCPFYTKDREPMFTKNCKSEDKHAGEYIRYMTGTSYKNESDGISYGSVAVHLSLPDDAQVGEKFKFVSTLFDTDKREKKVRLSKAIYTLTATDVSHRSLSLELFDPLPFEVDDLDVIKHNSLRLKVKRHELNASARPFVRASCARYIWGNGHEDHEDEGCSRHGLDDRYTPNNCPAGCECCMANGSCGECSGDHACIRDSDHGYNHGYGYCRSCQGMFSTQEEIQKCLDGAGWGFEHNGSHYDNTCGNELHSCSDICTGYEGTEGTVAFQCNGWTPEICHQDEHGSWNCHEISGCNVAGWRSDADYNRKECHTADGRLFDAYYSDPSCTDYLSGEELPDGKYGEGTCFCNGRGDWCSC